MIKVKITTDRAKELGFTVDKEDCLDCALCEDCHGSWNPVIVESSINKGKSCEYVNDKLLREKMTEVEYDAYRRNRLCW